MSIENLKKTEGETKNKESGADYYGLIVDAHNRASKGGYNELQKNRPEIVERIARQIANDLSDPQKQSDAYEGLKKIVDRLFMH